MAYNIIPASKEQQDALLNKHMKKSHNITHQVIWC